MRRWGVTNGSRVALEGDENALKSIVVMVAQFCENTKTSNCTL